MPIEAEIVRRVFALIYSGESLKNIARTLTDEAAPTRAVLRARDKGQPEPAARWNPSSVRDILTNPRYAGRVFYNGQVLDGVRGDWEGHRGGVRRGGGAHGRPATTHSDGHRPPTPRIRPVRVRCVRRDHSGVRRRPISMQGRPRQPRPNPDRQVRHRRDHRAADSAGLRRATRAR